VSFRAGVSAPQGYQSASQLSLAGGSQYLNSLDREQREVVEVVGPGRFKVSTDDGAEEVAGDHFVLVNGCLLIRSPQGNDLRCWAAGCWQGIELIG
jgi:hypothetical protein